MFAISVIVCEIFTVDMCMILTVRMGLGQICHSKGHMRLCADNSKFCPLIIVSFVLSVTICEKISFEMCMTMTF